ncbi:DUF4827 domain-containing protein [Bacteroides propionicifaciens]|jgi:hypothetical protein|uniref:DUF4827 domain-containing protein n=1 Tax=Bacteroides propionicifaciens TaxID=392838 RepID=UPI00037174C9|nr:DUF4827 domain-containing protein [Bacteroides propionicifaciens]
MKKTVFTILSVLAVLIAFQSCSKSRTYAERLADEKKAIERYIKKQDIKVISMDEFISNNKETDVDKNEYVELQTGLYMQIQTKGSENLADTFKTRSEITVRFTEYDIPQGYFTNASNINQANFVDAFIYTVDKDRLRGEFVDRGNMVEIYGSKTVPSGWLIPLKYIRHNGHIRVIVSSKLGHTVANREVTPYAYDLRKLAISKH